MPFLLTPLREGRHGAAPVDARAGFISTHAPAGGATGSARLPASVQGSFLLTPLREGRHADGDDCTQTPLISTHAPAGGATAADGPVGIRGLDFYSRPCGRGDGPSTAGSAKSADFYSRPCGRGDTAAKILLGEEEYFYSRPCGRGDGWQMQLSAGSLIFLLTPLREGRRK